MYIKINALALSCRMMTYKHCIRIVYCNLFYVISIQNNWRVVKQSDINI